MTRYEAASMKVEDIMNELIGVAELCFTLSEPDEYSDGAQLKSCLSTIGDHIKHITRSLDDVGNALCG